MSLFPFICLVAFTTLGLGARITSPNKEEQVWDEEMDKLMRGAHDNCADPKSVIKPASLMWPGSVDLSCDKCNDDSVMFQGPPPPPPLLRFTTAQLAAEFDVSIKIQNHCSKFDGDDSKKVIMIRHGQSKWNKVTEEYGVIAQAWGMQKKYTDSPLSQDGLRQAQRFAALLRDAEKMEMPANSDNSDDADKEVEPILRSQVRAAMKELSFTNLDQLVQINKNGATQADAVLVEGLRSHKEELQVLLGKRCSETAFVTSQLTRAMDTFNIAMLPARLNCDFPYEISSNLQEFEHNRDCEARNTPREHPTLAMEQRDEYMADQMVQTFRYMEDQYSKSNTDRFERNLDTRGRQRLIGSDPEHKKIIKNELKHILSEASAGKKYMLWGGHSIWFRFAFKFFGDQQNPSCVQLGKVKIANVGVVSATLRKVHNSESPYAFVDCKWIHLGPSDEFKYKFDPAVMSHVIPRPMDFRFGAKAIVGWKCCCPPTDAGQHEECLLARSGSGKLPKCWDSTTWGAVVARLTPDGVTKQVGEIQLRAMTSSDYTSWSSRYGWLDDKRNPWCTVPGID